MGKMRGTAANLSMLGATVFLGYMLYLTANENDGMLRIAELEGRIADQLAENRRIEMDNDLLRARIADLKRNPETMEAMARFQLNMIRPGEVFVQIPSAE